MDSKKKKTYIFFATGIMTVSGAPIYFQNKRKYLESVGWNVLVFSFMKGVPGLASLREFQDLVVPELKFFPYFYTRRKQKEIVRSILKKIPKSEEFIIETSHPLSAPWAEMVAEKLQCKHFIYSLAESVNTYGTLFQNLMRFKLRRGELVGIKLQSIPTLLGEPDNIDLQVPPLSVLPNHYITNVADVEFDKSEILPARINVVSIGRPNKPYFLPIMQDFCGYAKNNPKMDFNLIVVGEDVVTLDKLKRICQDCENVNLVLLGELFPIPEKLLACVDVCIAAAGSATLTKKFGISTISIDVNDCKPIGILDYNAFHNTFRTEAEPPIELDVLLDMVLKNHMPKTKFVLPDTYGKCEDYASHFDFVKKSEQSKDYFSFPKKNFKDRLITMGGLVVGLDRCNSFLKFLKKTLKR